MGLMTLTFILGQDFCMMHLLTKFHHPIFNWSESYCVDKETDFLKINLFPLCYAGGE